MSKLARAKYERNRRKRKAEARERGRHTEAEILILLDRQHHRCARCMRHEDICGILTKDHILPVSKGGSDAIDNIQLLCGPCNSRKNNRASLPRVVVVTSDATPEGVDLID